MLKSHIILKEDAKALERRKQIIVITKWPHLCGKFWQEKWAMRRFNIMGYLQKSGDCSEIRGDSKKSFSTEETLEIL